MLHSKLIVAAALLLVGVHGVRPNSELRRELTNNAPPLVAVAEGSLADPEKYCEDDCASKGYDNINPSFSSCKNSYSGSFDESFSCSCSYYPQYPVGAPVPAPVPPPGRRRG